MFNDCLLFLEVRFIDGAKWAYPVGGQVFEFGARGDAVVRVALRGVILIPAHIANILFHIVLDFGVNNSIETITFLALRRTIVVSLLQSPKHQQHALPRQGWL